MMRERSNPGRPATDAILLSIRVHARAELTPIGDRPADPGATLEAAALDFLAGAGPIHGHGGQDAGSYRPAAVDAVVQIRRPELLLAQGLRRVTKLVLFPVRFLYSAETGLVGTNHSAADHYLATNQAPGAALVAAAVLWRDHPPDHALATALLKREMIPLYLHYIDDHTTRLTAADRPDLSAAFIQWRDHIAI